MVNSFSRIKSAISKINRLIEDPYHNTEFLGDHMGIKIWRGKPVLVKEKDLPQIICPTLMITTLPANKNEKKEPALLKALSSREAEVAKWLVNGLSNREIGEKMFISIRTVKAHLTSIFKKTGCRDRLELATRMK